MGESSVRVGVVDIGTNSMRLLITDGIEESGRWVEVTGLGRGVDATGRLSQEAMERTMAVLAGFGERMDSLGVTHRAAVATSATRDASNREEFLDRAEQALGVRPEVISGGREGNLSFDGATADFEENAPTWVSDIGGGSTEIVSSDESDSVQMGSVRLSDRLDAPFPLPDRDRRRADQIAHDAFSPYSFGEVATHIGVAGTWTTLAALAADLPAYDDRAVHGYVLDTQTLSDLVDHLCGLTLEKTAAIPSMDPKRAPVIRCGAIIALAVDRALGVDETVVSVKDSLDGLAMELLDVT